MTSPISQDELLANERLNLDELRALQLERMRVTIANAYAGNRAYRARCEAHGVTPGDRDPHPLKLERAQFIEVKALVG
jgi:phenylacetate-coenzyme A ligase PaaK-like adenylate-forming protein